MGISDILWLFFMISALQPILRHFMSLFPQPTRTRPAVEYVPMPYRGREGRGLAQG